MASTSGGVSRLRLPRAKFPFLDGRPVDGTNQDRVDLRAKRAVTGPSALRQTMPHVLRTHSRTTAAVVERCQAREQVGQGKCDQEKLRPRRTTLRSLPSLAQKREAKAHRSLSD